MRGRKKLNFPAFFEAERKLREAGFEVENPATNPDGDLAQHVAWDAIRLHRSDAVALLPGHEDSAGSKLERAIAGHLSIPVFTLDQILADPSIVVPLGKRVVYETSEWQERVEKFPPLVASKEEQSRFEQLLGRMAELHAAKRSDYTGSSGDILFNYRTSAWLAGIEPHIGIFARLCEKVIRISSVLSKGGEVSVTDEKLTDTCLDIAVISLLLLIALEEEAANA
jgi:hypothetical protein